MPLMLARIEESHRYAVLEMGANHAGEIAYLTSLANPDIVVITNAAAAHLEGFGSIEGVARGKGEILRNEKRPQVAVLNADDKYFDYWSSLVTDVRRISFGFGETVPNLHFTSGMTASRCRCHSLAYITFVMPVPRRRSRMHWT